MANYFIFDNFSDADETKSIRAQAAAHVYIKKLGLDNLVTTDGKNLSATVTDFSDGKIRKLEIEPVSGSGIKNINDVVNRLISNYETELEREAELLPDIPDGIQFRAKVAGAYVYVSVLMNSREEIALRQYAHNTEYDIIGDKQSYLTGVAQKPHPYVLQSVLSQLKSTISKLYTLGNVGSGRLHVTYTLSNGALAEIDVFPPRVCQVADIEFAHEVMFDAQQKHGVISYMDGSTRIKLHRKHLDAKYDIQGVYDKEIGIIPQEKEEQDRMIQYLLRLPVVIRPKDDNEINVAYQTSPGTLRFIISPKVNSSLEIVGYDNAIRDGKVSVMNSSSPRIKEFSVRGGAPNITCLVFIERGGSSEKKSLETFANADMFDRFYQLYK